MAENEGPTSVQRDDIEVDEVNPNLVHAIPRGEGRTLAEKIEAEAPHSSGTYPDIVEGSDSPATGTSWGVLPGEDVGKDTGARSSGAMGANLLEARGVTMRFGGLVAVNSVDFNIPRGAIVSLIGPNGAGKTTFFNTITGLYKPTSGKLFFNGRDITQKSPSEVMSLGIARTFQNIRLFGNMTALENVLVGQHSRLKSGVFASVARLRSMVEEEKRAREKAQELLDIVDLTVGSDELAKNLPYGDQRRLEIARALGSDPQLLLLDEPTAGMNPNETQDLIEFIRGIRDRLHLTILLIEHDMKVVMGLSERITVLDYGTKIAEGLPAEVRANPRVVEAYLGRAASIES